MKKKVAVIGGGAWGTAVATVLTHNGHEVALWCLEKEVSLGINQTRENNRYLPGIKLSELLWATSNLQEALADTQWVFEAIPVVHMRNILEQARAFVSSEQRWVVLSKGIEQKTLLLPSRIVQDVLGKNTKVAVLAGPSFAQELVAQQLTAVALVAYDRDNFILKELQELVRTSYFVPEIHSDIPGVELCAALKNVLALGVGMFEGMKSGDNTKAFFLIKSLQELVVLLESFGGKKETVYGLAGIGDL